MKHPLESLVVVLPGIMGSELRNADDDVVWGTSLGTLVKGVLTRGAAVKRLRLPDGHMDEPAPDGVTATALLPDIHVIPGVWSVSIGYDRLLSWFREHFEVVDAPGDPRGPVNLVPFPYDWRLSNRASAAALKATVEPLLEEFRARSGRPDAELVFVCHSMGGLVARYYVDVLGGHEVTAKVITMGTPHRGALNGLASLVNGVSKGWGPLKIDLTELARSLPSLHQLLPEYACIESPSGLVKTTETTLPDLSTAMVADAMRFHEQIRDGAAANAASFDAHPILARTQPTDTTARIEDDRVVALRTFEGRDDGGDGTVPRLSASPYGVSPDSPTLRYVMDQHGALPGNDAVLVELEGVLTATDVVPRAHAFEIGVTCDDVVLAGEPVTATVDADPDIVVRCTLIAADGAEVARQTATEVDGTRVATFDDVAPGAYLVRTVVAGTDDAVVKPIVVAGPETD